MTGPKVGYRRTVCDVPEEDHLQLRLWAAHEDVSLAELLRAIIARALSNRDGAG